MTAPSRSRAHALSTVVLAASAALLVLLVGRTVLLPPGDLRIWDDALCEVIFALVAALAWCRAVAGGRRTADVLLAAGLTAYALGWMLLIDVVRSDVSAYPNVADAVWLWLYPLTVVGVLLHADPGRRLGWALWLDLLIGASGTAALVWTFLGPAEGGVLGMVVDAAYVIGDTALMVVLVSVLVMRRLRLTRGLWSAAAGVLLLVGTDCLYLAALATHGTLPFSSPITLGWPVAAGLVAMSIGREPAPPLPQAKTVSALLVPLVGATVSVGVLVTGAEHQAIVRVLAGAATLLAVARLGAAIREATALAGSRELALTDDLTGLPNRRAFYQEAERVLTSGTPATLLLLDLDGFKEVNDTLGHSSGDALLVLVSQRLAGVARHRRDSRDSDVVARLGGDEFAVLLPGTTAETGWSAIQRMVGALTASYEIDGIRVRVSAAAGVVHAPEHGADVDELLRRADVAMYASKSGRGGPGGAVVYRQELDTRSRDGLERVERVRTAVAQGRVVLHYQPKIHLGTGAITGVEALARLDVGDEGLLYPGAFLGLLAQAGELAALTEIVLDRALAQARRWYDQGLCLSVAVNVPADAVLDPALPRLVAAMLERHGVDGQALIVEVTEEVLLHDHVAGRAVLRELRELGAQISIDDYGTGYSSLAYLRDLPLDELKLDRSFVQAVSGDPRAERIIESTAALAHSLDLRIVAEGVETEAERDVVGRCGCDEGQGYLFSRPQPAEALAELLEERVLRGPLVPHSRGGA